jgi:hypothetical protein
MFCVEGFSFSVAMDLDTRQRDVLVFSRWIMFELDRERIIDSPQHYERFCSFFFF